jgi:hypothetical protein
MSVRHASHDQGVPSLRAGPSDDAASVGANLEQRIEEAQKALQQVRQRLEEMTSPPDHALVAALLYDLPALRIALHCVLITALSQIDELADSSVEDVIC